MLLCKAPLQPSYKAPLGTRRCYKVSLEPPPLQNEQLQLSQPVFIGKVLQLCDRLSGFSPDLLQQVHIFLVLRPPELDAAFRWGLTRAEMSREAQSTPSPYAALDAAEDIFGFLGCRYTLPGHVELFRHKHPLVLLSRETQFILHPASICACDCIDPGAGDLVFVPVKLHKVQTGTPLPCQGPSG